MTKREGAANSNVRGMGFVGNTRFIDCDDEQPLNAILDKVEEQAGHKAARTLEDTGYATGSELE